MIILRRKQFSQTQILNTNLGGGFIRGRKYDTALDRLGRMETAQRELHKVGDLGKEQRKMSSMINRGVRPEDLKD